MLVTPANLRRRPGVIQGIGTCGHRDSLRSGEIEYSRWVFRSFASPQRDPSQRVIRWTR